MEASAKTRQESGQGAAPTQTGYSNPGAPVTALSSEAARRAGLEAAGLVIRKAREPDLPDLLAMIRELAAFENLEDDLEVTAVSLRESLFGAHPAAAALVALLGSQPAGYAIYFHTFSSFAGRPGIFLEDLYVRPAFRRQGIGRGLLEQVAAIGVRRGCGRLEWIALRWNGNALRFYESVGAKPLDEWVMLRMREPGMKALASSEWE